MGAKKRNFYIFILLENKRLYDSSLRSGKTGTFADK